MQALVAPVLARWRNKLLAGALEAFQENVAAAQSKRQQVQRALQYWNNRALAGAFAQWIDTVEVSKWLHKLRDGLILQREANAFRNGTFWAVATGGSHYDQSVVFSALFFFESGHPKQVRVLELVYACFWTKASGWAIIDMM